MSGARQVTDGELLDALRRYGDLLGETPAASRMERDCKHAPWLHYPNVYRSRFGSWNEALVAAGFEVREGVGRPRE